MEMTIKQLADELGVSKPTIRNIVSELGIQSKLRKVGNRYMLSDAQITQVKLQILKDGVLSESKKTEKSESGVLSESKKTEKSENSIVREQLSILSQQLTVKDNQIQVLQDQLIVKDSQIQILQEQIRQLTAAMDSMATALTGAQALHAGTIQKQLTGYNDRVEHSSDPEPQKQKQGFFSRLFGKNTQTDRQ